jgi:predicted Ser/Thr protein kinase
VGAYTILGRIGQGGMGAVYLGQSPDGRKVAVKVVRPELARDSGFVARFQDEVANAQRVASFCTAQVLDHGESGGHPFMVTEYIDGVSLKEYVAENGELSPGMLQGVAVGVAAALVSIHAAGLIHRDLKPANVLLSYSGPRVIDFGIARALDAAHGHTMTGQVIGSPGWMAPEQILQQPVTTAADIFAWGCLVAYAKNGINPFGQGDLSVMAARLVHGDPQVGTLPAPLDRLVRAALDKEPRKRPTAKDLLLTIVGGDSAEAAVMGTLAPTWQPPVPPPTRSATLLSGPGADSPDPTAYGGGPAGRSGGSATPGLGPAAYSGDPSGHGGSPATPGSGQGAYPAAYSGDPGGRGGGSVAPGGSPAAYAAGRGGGSGAAGHGGPPTQVAGPAAHGMGSGADRGSGARGGGPATQVSGPGGAGAGPPTMPAGPVVSPPEPPGTGPTSPMRPSGSGRGRAILAAGVAAVIGAGAVTGWFVFHSNGTPATTRSSTTTPKGPPPMTNATLVARYDRRAGWPDKCYASIGVLSPVTKTARTPFAEAGATCDYLPKWSPDRRRIAFTRSDGSATELWIANADGQEPKKIAEMGARSRVAWSPDGSKIAMVGSPHHTIEVINLGDPSNPLRLTNDDSEKDDPAWCGNQVAFWSKKSGIQQIYTVDASTPGGSWKQITHEDHDVNDPAFSPDCSKMAYTDQPDSTNRHIWVVNIDGTQKKQLTPDDKRDMDAAWSKDGNWIAFARGSTAFPIIWAMRPDGSDERQISPKGVNMGQPAWY